MALTALALPLAASGPNIPNFGQADKCVQSNGAFCWSWVQANWGGKLAPALVQHIELTAIAVGIGLVIALGTALAAYRFGWLSPPLGGFYDFLYTIPSLALFQILVPVTGISRLTVELALVSYTLLILFRNTLTGLHEVPDEVREAAEGMGFTSLQRVLRVDLPLAVPAIIAGLRVATVTVISLATVAAYIINEGLGAPIFEGISAGAFKTEIIAGGVLAILLALAADALLLAVQRLATPWARARARGARPGIVGRLRERLATRVAARTAT